MNRDILLKAVFMCIALILVLVILYSGLRVLESTVFLKQQEEGPIEAKSISRDGVEYYPRQDIMVVMLLGIERQGEVVANEVNKGDPADMVMLMVFDEKTAECTLVSLNRDTMVMMPGLNEYGRADSKYFGQLALSHTFGTGLEDSCENTRKTVSDLLYGITIDHYIAMNMDAIAILNDAVGGVTVTVRDDFSQVDPTITKGQATLNGQQALNFVQARRNVGNELNLSRMERQQEYMRGFINAFRANIDASDSFVLKTYEQVSPYLVTDCSVTVMTDMMGRYADYELQEIVSLPGENVLGERYYEFHVDEEKLDELILRIFYAPKG